METIEELIRPHHFLIPALLSLLGTLWIHPKVLKIAKKDAKRRKKNARA